MNFNVNQVVSSSDLNIDVETIMLKLEDISEMLVFSDNQPKFIVMSLQQYAHYVTPKEASNQKDPMTKEAGCAVKIGAFVRESMQRLISNNLLPPAEITNLTDAAYCSTTFGLSYPVFRPYDSSRPLAEQKRDANNKYNRYYNFILDSQYGKYLLCSQWVEPLHRARYEKWLKQWM